MFKTGRLRRKGKLHVHSRILNLSVWRTQHDARCFSCERRSLSWVMNRNLFVILSYIYTYYLNPFILAFGKMWQDLEYVFNKLVTHKVCMILRYESKTRFNKQKREYFDSWLSWFTVILIGYELDPVSFLVTFAIGHANSA